MIVPFPINEPERLEALRALRLVGPSPGERFGRFPRDAAQLFKVPMAALTLLEQDEQLFLSSVGIGAGSTPTQRWNAFCSHTILVGNGRLIVPDARIDPRFAGHPAVLGAPHLRFYAGQVIHCPRGFRLGALCIMDTQPRYLGASGISELGILVRGVEAEIVRRCAELAEAG